MSTLIDRKTFIGGSDISCVMGLSRYKTPLQLWCEKTGRVEPKDLSDNEAVELGSELEDFVAKKFERKTGKKVRRAPQIYQNKRIPHFRCQVDRLVEGTDELLEVKTCSAWKEKEWGGEEIPEEYICQVQWQLGITGRSVGYIAVLIGGQKFRMKRLKYDEAFFTKMVERATTFWGYVQDDVMPMATGMDNDFIAEVYPTNNELMEEANNLNDAIALRQETVMHIKALEEQKDDAEAKIKQRIGENLGIKTDRYEVTWKRQPKTSVDSEKLKADNLYDKYKKVSDTRVLRVKNAEVGK